MFDFISATIMSEILLLVAVSIEDGGLFDWVVRRNPANTPGARRYSRTASLRARRSLGAKTISAGLSIPGG